MQDTNLPLQQLFEGLLQSAASLRDQLTHTVDLQEREPFTNSKCPFRLYTDHPVAVYSHDHIFPLGTKQDNTHHPRFVARCEEVLDRPLKVLDLGCAGGGLVLDFLRRGHESFGLEGSDYPKKHQNFEWKRIPDRLNTCDITKRFVITDQSGAPALFDVISMWEVLEHIQEHELPQLLSNIRNHLSPRGLFCASVATFEHSNPETGAVWHVTVKPKSWWQERLRLAGLELVDGLFTVKDFPRGSGNGAQDWDALREPHMGFHVVARRTS